MEGVRLISRTTARICAPGLLLKRSYSTATVKPSVSGCCLSEFAERRATLMRQLPPGSLAVFPAASKSYMSGEIPYRFRQDSNFLYFSGLREPDAVLLVRSDRSTSEKCTSTLIVTPRDPAREVWDNQTVDVAETPALYGVEVSASLKDLKDVLESEIAMSEHVFLEPRRSLPSTTRHRVEQMVTETVVKGSGGIVSGLNRQVDAIRAVKSSAEIELMATACSQATRGIHYAMLESPQGHTEHSLAAIAEFGCKLDGAAGVSFPPVVAGGPRALVLHYSPTPDSPHVTDPDMVLMDFGAEHLGYSSDISRTWPVSGRFADPQRELYEAVLRVQNACLELCTADGETSLSHIQRQSVALTADELVRLGIFRSEDVKGANALANIRRVFPHSIGHYLGMDVHDTPGVPLNRPLVPGMVITIEPGLYIPDSPDMPSAFRGLGIRIEDDVLVTADGPRILSADCAKTPDEIEALISSGRD